jgi:hypothetical protein
MLLSVERPFVGAFAVHIPRATLLLRNGLVQAVLPASTEHVQTDNRGSPGTWEILSFPRQHPGRSYRVTNSRPRRRTRPPRSERNEWNRGTAKRRKRSAAGWAAGSRSALIVPLKQGNSPRRTLWRKAKRRPADPIEGNMSNTSRFDQHVPVTRSDSLGDHRGW